MSGGADKVPDKLETNAATSGATKSAMTPREIVSELDRHIVGQQAAKRAVAIGSGGAYAQAAARALLAHTEMAPAEMVKKSLEIAGDICIYTNQTHVIEVLE